MLNREIYQLMESTAPWLIIWIAVFALLNLRRIQQHRRRDQGPGGHSVLFVEAAGLPLALMHTVCFVKAIQLGDWLSVLLFAWWGPGFIGIAWFYLKRQKQQRRINWHPLRHLIAWACKLNYLFFLVIYAWFGLWQTLFVFSIWIINDQIGMLWISDDADRLRRTLDDGWLVRLAYPAGLFIPLFTADFPARWYCLLLGVALSGLWIAGIVRVCRLGKLRWRPDDPSLLRNMVYFAAQKKYEPSRELASAAGIKVEEPQS